MRAFVFVLGLILCVNSISAAFAEYDLRVLATPCNATACKPPNCYCLSTDIPGNLAPANTPQLVVLTFDDAIGPINIGYYREALTGRKNPNNCSIAATFFTTHEYTDYTLVNELYKAGHEIALHSISHESNTNYWKDASVATLTAEIADQKKTINKFANIPEAEIKGIRMPFLQMSGNNQMQMLKTNNFLYDLSWPTQAFMQPGLWPYTLDYKTDQDCLIPPCPTDSYPGLWVIPMISWMDNNGTICAMADACVGIPNTTAGVLDWMKREFNKQYTGNRAPVGLYLHAAWFGVNPIHFEAYKQFLDYLKTLNSVYIVTASQVIDWMKAPRNVTQMNTFPCRAPTQPACSPRTCELIKEGTITRWMTSCVSQCPLSYPWVGNPLGDKPPPQ